MSNGERQNDKDGKDYCHKPWMCFKHILLIIHPCRTKDKIYNVHGS